MESNGEAGRIHLAPSTAALLASTGRYKLENRGTIAVKGKGNMNTSWLVETTDACTANPDISDSCDNSTKASLGPPFTRSPSTASVKVIPPCVTNVGEPSALSLTSVNVVHPPLVAPDAPGVEHGAPSIVAPQSDYIARTSSRNSHASVIAFHSLSPGALPMQVHRHNVPNEAKIHRQQTFDLRLFR